MITRREAARLFATTALAGTLGLPGGSALAAEKVLKIGLPMPYTGADAEDADRIRDGALMAFQAANEANAVPGYRFDTVALDNGTATAGQYDPAQAATNARKMVSDPQFVASVGPVMSGDGKSMTPILSEGDLATITPASTNPDITNPKFAAEFDPSGKAIYFRTVTTDAYQGPNMANFMAEKLHVKSVFILDDSGAYGVGMANAFEAEAKKKGMKVVGRDRLDPKNSDYSAVLTKIKALNPQAIYYGGVAQAGVTLAKQSYEIVPHMIKAGGDGVFGASFLKGAGFPAVEGWYATIAAPHITASKAAENWVRAYKAKFGVAPTDYSITAYDAALVVIDAVKRIVADHKPVNRHTVRDYIQTAHVPTLQGVVSFDKYGDLKNHIVSVFQIRKNPKEALDDPIAQYAYIGVAPQA